MKTIDKIKEKPLPKHVAIILDGNGRWAKKRGLSRSDGHKYGALNLRRIALLSESLGIDVLSVYAFSTENWKRPQAEVDYLMQLPKVFEEEFKDDFEKYNIRVTFSGRRDRLSKDNIALLKRVEKESENRMGLILNICLDYGSQHELVHATQALATEVKKGIINVNDITEAAIESHLYTKDLPAVDYLIRTSGEVRISNFLLWQIAYAELYFTKTPWPAFKEKQFLKAIKSYQKRNRRFGGLKG
jgi:undecaprenyl diphosphate synthase